MSFVKGSQRATGKLGLWRVCDSLSLPPSRRRVQQILNRIQRQTAVLKMRCWSGWNSVGPLGSTGERWDLLIAPRQFVQLPVALVHGVVVHPVTFVPSSADTEHNRLLVRDRLGFHEPVDRLVLKLWCQDSTAVVDAIERNYHYQHSAGAYPTPDVLQKQALHPLVLALADLEVVRRVEVHHRERLNGSVGVKRVALDHFVEDLAGFFRTIRVELDTVLSRRRSVRQGAKRGARTGARVENARGIGRELQMLPNPNRFGLCQRVVAKLQTCLSSHDRGAPYTTGKAEPVWLS